MNIQLDDRLYKEAQRRAAEAGFETVDAYIADVVRFDLSDAGPGTDETPNLDHLFTPERLTKIKAADADIEAGNFLTEEQMQQYLQQARKEWDLKNPR